LGEYNYIQEWGGGRVQKKYILLFTFLQIAPFWLLEDLEESFVSSVLPV